MRKNISRSLKLALGGGLILIAALIFIPLRSGAQTIVSPLILTWQANNYFPADYPGKALVTPNTVVVASVELLQNNKLADLTKANIQWYVNGDPTINGVGLKTTSFIAKPQSDGYVSLKASVTLGNSSYDGSDRIPTTQPQIVISTPDSKKSVPAGSQTTVLASPYFFNINSLDDLSFFWSVNNQAVASSGDQIAINVGTLNSDYQGLVQISVTAQNKNFLYEMGKETTNLSIMP